MQEAVQKAREEGVLIRVAPTSRASRALLNNHIRVLAVDDFEPSRRWVRSKLKTDHLHIVGEAADGLEAVQKAQELIPDLILLDIGLPNLNGILAAERIHHVLPGVNILFFSQQHDIDVVRTALSNGAKGYVLKADAESERPQ